MNKESFAACLENFYIVIFLFLFSFRDLCRDLKQDIPFTKQNQHFKFREFQSLAKFRIWVSRISKLAPNPRLNIARLSLFSVATHIVYTKTIRLWNSTSSYKCTNNIFFLKAPLQHLFNTFVMNLCLTKLVYKKEYCVYCLFSAFSFRICMQDFFVQF